MCTLSSQLSWQLDLATQNYTSGQSRRQADIIKLADGAVVALDLGKSPTTLPAPWKTVTPATQYTAGGVGRTSNCKVHCRTVATAVRATSAYCIHSASTLQVG